METDKMTQINKKIGHIVNSFDTVQLSSDLDESLQFEVLKLRFCRWHFALDQLVQYADKSAMENIPTKQLMTYLGWIADALANDQQPTITAPGSPRNHPATANHWLTETLRRLSLKRRVSMGLQTSKHDSPRGMIPKDSQTIMASAVALLEINALKESLSCLRGEDAREFWRHPKKSDEEILNMKRIAADVDGDFAQFLITAGHIYVDSRSSGTSTLHQGDLVASDYHGPIIPASNAYFGTSAQDASTLVQGTSHGYNPYEKSTKFGSAVPESESDSTG